ncbi:hypothetical protein ABVK25_011734 [Lepraria finkii]|uniref:Prion-inhibition and propagation HeLo domain-containing protein n=1 Tax=Lepraria finkii TaxID=1340010 RepID=A0ABR4AMY2_9LECA
MEAAGLAVGVAGLAGLFSTCVECFDYIQLGRQFGQDYGKCLLKLDVARLQLSRWGAAMGLGTVENSGLQQQHLAFNNSSQEITLAQTLLMQILDSFEEAERMSAKYMGYVSSNSANGPADLGVSNLNTTAIGAEYRRVHLTILELAGQRQKDIGIRKKAMWALYEKKKFDRLIDDVTVFIGQLVGLFPAVQDEQRALCKTEVAKFPQIQDLALLNDVVPGDDQILSGEITREMASRGHVYTDLVASENTQVWAGDDNVSGMNNRGHVYNGLNASGNSVVHLGNVNRGPPPRR